MEIENVKITEFALRHFDPDFGGTKILDKDSEEVEEKLGFALYSHYNPADLMKPAFRIAEIHEGYAPFCKLVAFNNLIHETNYFSNAKVGSLPLNYETLANHQYVRHGFSSRRKGEFESFSRWLELPVSAPIANYLMFVLYSKAQIDKEAIAMYNKKKAEGGINAIGLEKPEPFSKIEYIPSLFKIVSTLDFVDVFKKVSQFSLCLFLIILRIFRVFIASA